MEFRSGKSDSGKIFCCGFLRARDTWRVHSSSLAVPGNDPTAAVYQCGDEPVQGMCFWARSGTRLIRGRRVRRNACARVASITISRTLGSHGGTTLFLRCWGISRSEIISSARSDCLCVWELLTSPAWFGIDPARLYVTIFEGDAAVPRDAEANGVLAGGFGVSAERIFELGAKDNFWAMGDTGALRALLRRFIMTWAWRVRRRVRTCRLGKMTSGIWSIWNLVFDAIRSRGAMGC